MVFGNEKNEKEKYIYIKKLILKEAKRRESSSMLDASSFVYRHEEKGYLNR
jgi:hypothetical protein